MYSYIIYRYCTCHLWGAIVYFICPIQALIVCKMVMTHVR